MSSQNNINIIDSTPCPSNEEIESVKRQDSIESFPYVNPLEDQEELHKNFSDIFFGVRRETIKYDNMNALRNVTYTKTVEEENEIEEKLGKQMRFQLATAGFVIFLFIIAFGVIISLMLSGKTSLSYLQLEPISVMGGNKISFHVGAAVESLVGRLQTELAEYQLDNWFYKAVNAGYRVIDCILLGRYPSRWQICKPHLNNFGPCNIYDSFGYLQGSPCILLKPGGSLNHNYTEDIRVRCDSTNVTLEIEYYPTLVYQGKLFTYFPRYFFPYRNNIDFYLPPPAMVRLKDPPKSKDFELTCYIDNKIFANTTEAKVKVNIFIT